MMICWMKIEIRQLISCACTFIWNQYVARRLKTNNFNADDLVAATKEIVIGDVYKHNLAFQLQIFADMVEETFKDIYLYYYLFVGIVVDTSDIYN